MRPGNWPKDGYACRVFNFNIVHPSGIKRRPEDVLSLLHWTGTDESTLEGEFPLFTVTNAFYKSHETETDSSNQFDLIWMDKNDKLSPGIPEVLQTADEADSKKLLTTTDFVTIQATDP